MPTRTTSHPVVTNRDVDVLLGRLGLRHERLESALERDILRRAKVGGQWLFFTDEASLRRAREAELAARVPVADDLCVEADSGWHSDQGASHVLLPVLLALRDELKARHGYAKRVRVGVAEGIGTRAYASSSDRRHVPSTGERGTVERA